MLLIALLVSACGAAGAGSNQPISAGDKAGGRAATVLTLGGIGTPGDAGADYIEHFAAEPDQISAACDDRDQAPRRQVRAWFGLTSGSPSWSMRATWTWASSRLARSTSSESRASRRCRRRPGDRRRGHGRGGVERHPRRPHVRPPVAGLRGPALWPEGLRHPYSFGAPILTLSDFDDLGSLPGLEGIVRSIAGARCEPHDLGDAREDDDAAESGIRTIANINRPGVVTGNITFFPKIQMLVAGSAAFAR